MIPLLSIFGALERLAADLYPYRWLITAGVLLAMASALFLAYRRGWHRYIWRHRLATALIGGPLLAAVLIGGYPLVSPLWQRSVACEGSPISGAGAGSKKCASEAAANAVAPTATSAAVVQATATPAAFTPHAIRRGSFHGADDFHFGRGNALLIEATPGRYTLRFEEFSVRNGPDLHVYLTNDPEGYGTAPLELGTLKATDGAFNYDLPEGTDIAQFKSALVWCKQFTVLFAVAPLAPV